MAAWWAAAWWRRYRGAAASSASAAALAAAAAASAAASAAVAAAAARADAFGAAAAAAAAARGGRGGGGGGSGLARRACGIRGDGAEGRGAAARRTERRQRLFAADFGQGVRRGASLHPVRLLAVAHRSGPRVAERAADGGRPREQHHRAAEPEATKPHPLAPAADARHRAVGEAANDRLHSNSRNRPGQPRQCERVIRNAELLQHRRHLGVLARPRQPDPKHGHGDEQQFRNRERRAHIGAVLRQLLRTGPRRRRAALVLEAPPFGDSGAARRLPLPALCATSSICSASRSSAHRRRSASRRAPPPRWWPTSIQTLAESRPRVRLRISASEC